MYWYSSIIQNPMYTFIQNLPKSNRPHRRTVLGKSKCRSRRFRAGLNLYRGWSVVVMRGGFLYQVCHVLFKFHPTNVETLTRFADKICAGILDLAWTPRPQSSPAAVSRPFQAASPSQTAGAQVIFSTSNERKVSCHREGISAQTRAR